MGRDTNPSWAAAMLRGVVFGVAIAFIQIVLDGKAVGRAVIAGVIAGILFAVAMFAIGRYQQGRRGASPR